MCKLIQILAFFYCVSTAGAIDIYLSPDGKDSNPGTQNKPLKTLTAARDIIRSEAGPAAGSTVYLTEGRYYISETFELSEIDSGSEKKPVVYKALAGDKVYLDGGRVVPNTKIKKVTDPKMLSRFVPEAKDKIFQIDIKSLGIHEYGDLGPRGFMRPYKSAPLELIINGKMQHVSRWPNEGEQHIAMGKVHRKGSEPRYGDKTNTGGIFEYVTKRAERWTQAEDMYISGIFAYGYAEDTVQIAKIDTEAGTIETVQPHCYGFGKGNQKSLWKWYALNLIEEIDQPGEYCIDKINGIIYFYPSEEMKDALVQVSMMEEPMVAMEGASFVHFENITFENTRGTGIYIEGGQGNLIAGCTMRNIGIVAVQIGQGATDLAPMENGFFSGRGRPVSRKLDHYILYREDMESWDRNAGRNHGILSCNIYETGAGGIEMGGGDRRTLTPGGNFVMNCDIHHVNRWDRTYRAPVNVTGVGNIISNNYFHHCPGIGVFLHGNDHIVEYNEFAYLVSDMSDQGAIYMGRDISEAGNIFRYNFFHHTQSGHTGGYGNSGIFFDDGQVQQYVYGNIFYKTGSNGAIKYHGGQFNSFINNIVVDCKHSVFFQGWNQKKWEKFYNSKQQQHRINEAVDIFSKPYSTKYPLLTELYNIKYGKENNIELRTFRTTASDPLFVDGEAMNFKIKDYNELRKKVAAFEPINFEEIGLYVDDYRKQLPEKSKCLTRKMVLAPKQ